MCCDEKTERFRDEPQQVTMSHFLTWPLPALVHHKHTLGNTKTHNASVKVTILHMQQFGSKWGTKKKRGDRRFNLSLKKPIDPFGPRRENSRVQNTWIFCPELGS